MRMSDDLISRKAFVDELKLYCNRTFLGEITSSSEISVGELSTIIKKLPSAYNIDAVCDELENYLFEKYCIEGDEKIDDIVRNEGKNV